MAASLKKPSFTETFPQCAEVIGAFRAQFGADVKPVYCEEGGRSVGRPLDESRYTVICGADLVLAPKKEKNNGR